VYRSRDQSTDLPEDQRSAYRSGDPSTDLPEDQRSGYRSGDPSTELPEDQRSAYRSGDPSSPISVILVSSGSRGNKLLFRYPFQRPAEGPASPGRFESGSSLGRVSHPQVGLGLESSPGRVRVSHPQVGLGL